MTQTGVFRRFYHLSISSSWVFRTGRVHLQEFNAVVTEYAVRLQFSTERAPRAVGRGRIINIFQAPQNELGIEQAVGLWEGETSRVQQPTTIYSVTTSTVF